MHGMAVNAVNVLSLLPLPLPCIVALYRCLVSLSLNVNIQKLKSVSRVPRGTSAMHEKQNLKIVPYGTIAMQLLRIQVGVQT